MTSLEGQQLPDTNTWWSSVEPLGFTLDSIDRECVRRAFPDWPVWLVTLCDSYLSLAVGPDLEEKRKLLIQIDQASLSDPWQRVLRLLLLMCEVHLGPAPLEQHAEQLQAFIDTVPDEETATLVQAHQALASAHCGLGHHRQALVALLQALVLVEDSTAKWRTLDEIGALFIDLGWWSGADRVLRAVCQARERLGDQLGLSASAGKLAELELLRANPKGALSICAKALAVGKLPLLARMRLIGRQIEALLELNGIDDLRESGTALEQLLAGAGDRLHPENGKAALCLARTARAVGNEGTVERWLECARENFTSQASQSLLQFFRFCLFPDDPSSRAWLAEEVLGADAAPDQIAEAHWRAHIHLAAQASSAEQARLHLERALALATTSGQPSWLRQVELAFSRMDESGFRECVSRNRSGSGEMELQEAGEMSATLVSADMVGVGEQEATVLQPESVLEAVRCMFELSVPLMAQHDLVPLLHLSDGLLAICRGEGHESRALHFARDYVLQAERLFHVRRAISDPQAVRLRVGVSSGNVVFGRLGYPSCDHELAIGRAVSRAPLLHAEAFAGEIVADAVLAERAGLAGNGAVREAIQLLGYDEPIEVVRLRPHETARWLGELCHIDHAAPRNAEALPQINRKTVQSQHASARLRPILSQAAENLGAASVAFWLLSADGEYLQGVLQHTNRPRHTVETLDLAVGDTILGLVAMTGAGSCLDGLDNQEPCIEASDGTALIAVPVYRDEEILGVLSATCANNRASFDDSDLDRLAASASSLESALRALPVLDSQK